MKKLLLTILALTLFAPIAVNATSLFSVQSGTAFTISTGTALSMLYTNGCTPSYANNGGTGNRTSIITETTNGVGMTSLTALLDGDTTSNGRNFWNVTPALDGSQWVKFDFGSGSLAVITESKYYQQTSTDQGTWKWQGSNDNSAWTDIGTTFSLATAATTISTTMSANTTGYRYYRMLGISGANSNGPWIYQMEFKICGI